MGRNGVIMVEEAQDGAGRATHGTQPDETEQWACGYWDSAGGASVGGGLPDSLIFQQHQCNLTGCRTVHPLLVDDVFEYCWRTDGAPAVVDGADTDGFSASATAAAQQAWEDRGKERYLYGQAQTDHVRYPWDPHPFVWPDALSFEGAAESEEITVGAGADGGWASINSETGTIVQDELDDLGEHVLLMMNPLASYVVACDEKDEDVPKDVGVLLRFLCPNGRSSRRVLVDGRVATARVQHDQYVATLQKAVWQDVVQGNHNDLRGWCQRSGQLISDLFRFPGAFLTRSLKSLLLGVQRYDGERSWEALGTSVIELLRSCSSLEALQREKNDVKESQWCMRALERGLGTGFGVGHDSHIWWRPPRERARDDFGGQTTLMARDAVGKALMNAVFNPVSPSRDDVGSSDIVDVGAHDVDAPLVQAVESVRKAAHEVLDAMIGDIGHRLASGLLPSHVFALLSNILKLVLKGKACGPEHEAAAMYCTLRGQTPATSPVGQQGIEYMLRLLLLLKPLPSIGERSFFCGNDDRNMEEGDEVRRFCAMEGEPKDGTVARLREEVSGVDDSGCVVLLRDGGSGQLTVNLRATSQINESDSCAMRPCVEDWDRGGNDRDVHCVCGGGRDEYGCMLQCSSCSRFFHGECVPALVACGGRVLAFDRDLSFFCGRCAVLGRVKEAAALRRARPGAGSTTTQVTPGGPFGTGSGGGGGTPTSFATIGMGAGMVAGLGGATGSGNGGSARRAGGPSEWSVGVGDVIRLGCEDSAQLVDNVVSHALCPKNSSLGSSNGEKDEIVSIASCRGVLKSIWGSFREQALAACACVKLWTQPTGDGICFDSCVHVYQGLDWTHYRNVFSNFSFVASLPGTRKDGDNHVSDATLCAAALWESPCDRVDAVYGSCGYVIRDKQCRLEMMIFQALYSLGVIQGDIHMFMHCFRDIGPFLRRYGWIFSAGVMERGRLVGGSALLLRAAQEILFMWKYCEYSPLSEVDMSLCEEQKSLRYVEGLKQDKGWYKAHGGFGKVGYQFLLSVESGCDIVRSLGWWRLRYGVVAFMDVMDAGMLKIAAKLRVLFGTDDLLEPDDGNAVWPWLGTDDAWSEIRRVWHRWCRVRETGTDQPGTLMRPLRELRPSFSKVALSVDKLPPCFRIDRTRCCLRGIAKYQGYRSARCTHAVATGVWYYEVDFLGATGGGEGSTGSGRDDDDSAAIAVGWGSSFDDCSIMCGYSAMSYSMTSGDCICYSRALPLNVLRPDMGCKEVRERVSASGAALSRWFDMSLRDDDDRLTYFLDREQSVASGAKPSKDAKENDDMRTMTFDERLEPTAVLPRAFVQGDTLGCIIRLPPWNGVEKGIHEGAPRGKSATVDVVAPLRPVQACVGAEVHYFLNGKYLGCAFRDLAHTAFSPFVSIYGAAAVQCRFDAPFKYPPPESSGQMRPTFDVGVVNPTSGNGADVGLQDAVLFVENDVQTCVPGSQWGRNAGQRDSNVMSVCAGWKPFGACGRSS